MNESRHGMRSSLIAAQLVGLLVFPAILPAGDAPVMRAENLGDTTLSPLRKVPQDVRSAGGVW